MRKFLLFLFVLTLAALSGWVGAWTYHQTQVATIVGGPFDILPRPRPRPPRPDPEPTPAPLDERLERDRLSLLPHFLAEARKERRRDFESFSNDLKDALERTQADGTVLYSSDEEKAGFFPGAGMLAGVIVKAVVFVIHAVFVSNVVWFFWTFAQYLIPGFIIAVSLIFWLNGGIFGGMVWIKSWFVSPTENKKG